MVINFSDFSKLYNDFDIKELFDFYSVFDEFIFDNKKNLYENILDIFIKNAQNILLKLNLDENSLKALCILSKNDRKRYSINKFIPHFQALGIINKLLEKNILILEKSQEKPIIKNKRQKIKKELRSYIVQDKLIFKNQGLRFFFYFVYPNLNLVDEKKYDKLLELIKNNLENYQSLIFEFLAKDFLAKKLKVEQVFSFWNYYCEIDLYYHENGFCVLGEAKFKERKICKNILNILKNKAKQLQIQPNLFVLFSKSGFSKELVLNKERNLLLYTLDDFKFLLKE
ncbi:ATP-binding protein [Campylobacter peloridis]|uniref:ATP-binding protein n=1 Tax=Campylobacter peloridis TaxID=488546 RepID=A0ABX6TUM9_9BACT|nr:ATP-binding protein [Campylobacter peloridis]